MISVGDDKARIRGDVISDGRSQGFEPKTELPLLTVTTLRRDNRLHCWNNWPSVVA